jgi:cation:H+ antiporter
MTPFACDLLAMLGAVALAGIGGELFLKGALSTATVLRVPRLLVATGIAAFATSSPDSPCRRPCLVVGHVETRG